MGICRTPCPGFALPGVWDQDLIFPRSLPHRGSALGARHTRRASRSVCEDAERVPAAASDRYRWTEPTVTDPSPTAPATRLTDPKRTSPAANTPAALVSNGSGARCPGHADCGMSRPVRMNPRSSTFTTSRSQSVCGSAPMSTKTAVAGTPSWRPVRRFSNVRASRWILPRPSTTRVSRRTSTFGVSSAA